MNLKHPIKIFKWTIPVWSLLLLIGGVVSAIVLLGVITWTGTVIEPLDYHPKTVNIGDMYAGETKNTTITITNHANVKQNIGLNYSVNSNPNNVTYEINYNPSSMITIPASSSATVDINVKILQDSNLGTLGLTFSVYRISSSDYVNKTNFTLFLVNILQSTGVTSGAGT